MRTYTDNTYMHMHIYKNVYMRMALSRTERSWTARSALMNGTQRAHGRRAARSWTARSALMDGELRIRVRRATRSRAARSRAVTFYSIK